MILLRKFILRDFVLRKLLLTKFLFLRPDDLSFLALRQIRLNCCYRVSSSSSRWFYTWFKRDINAALVGIRGGAVLIFNLFPGYFIDRVSL